MKRQTAALSWSRLLWVLLLTLLAGCASSSSNPWTGPSAKAPVNVEPWSDTNPPTSGTGGGKILQSPHYAIHTTITDPDVLDKLPQVMEGAYAQYQAFVIGPQQFKPMNCYVFAKRTEWAQFTAQHTGADAAIYLQITRGGYTIGDWFVSYYVGENATYSVASHEGWHQYVARHFKGRLPPFLEEGTACMFENVKFKDGLPRWDLSLNPNRALALRNAIEDRKLWPLEKLVTMHAGDVVRLPGDRIEAFYSQDWAFARFLWEYNNGEYRPKFKKLLAEVAAGTAREAGGIRRPGNLWSPSSVKPMLEHYLGKDLPAIEEEYLDFCHSVAYEQFGKYWNR